MLLKKIGFMALILLAANANAQQVAKAVDCKLVSSPGTKIVINGGITFTGTSNWKDSGEVFIQKNTTGGFGSENWMDSTAAGVYDITSNGKINFVSDSFQYIYGNTKFYNLRSASDSGVYLNSNIEVRNQLDLDKSLLYTLSTTKVYVSNTAINAIQSTNSFATSWVHGKLERAANITGTDYVFPVGKIKTGQPLYAPIKLGKSNSNTARYEVEYFPTTPPNQSNINVGAMDHISYVEYWEILSNIVSGPDDDAIVHLSWRGYSQVSSNAVIRDSLVVAQYITSPTTWWDVPSGWFTGNSIGPDSLSGYVKSTNAIGSFLAAEKWFTIGTRSPNNALPVKLLYFTAVADGNRVRLNWNVEQEEDVVRYEVERSLTGSLFSKIGTVTSLQKAAWLYTDFDLSPVTGWNYYRLKIIDKSGKISYSGIRKVRFDKGLQMVSIFPNPTTDVLNIQLPSSYSAKTILQLMTIDGKMLSSIKPAGTSVQLNVRNLPAATYLLNIITEDGKIKSYPFIKN